MAVETLHGPETKLDPRLSEPAQMIIHTARIAEAQKADLTCQESSVRALVGLLANNDEVMALFNRLYIQPNKKHG